MSLRPFVLYITTMLTSLPALADSPHSLSLTASLATNYMFRGVSQTDNKPALQVGIDYAHHSGFVAGLFLSNIDYNTSANREQDIYFGYGATLANGITIDANALYYGYNNESSLNYSEYNIGASYKWLDTRYWYAGDYSGTGGKQEYFEAGLSVPLNDDFTLGIHAGYSDFEPRTGINDYSDYSLSLSTSYQGFDLQLLASSNDTGQFGDSGDDQIVFTVSRSFDLLH